MRRRKWFLALAMAGVLLVALAAIPAFTFGPRAAGSDPADVESYCPGHELMWDYRGVGDAVTLGRVASVLGLTYDGLMARLNQGESVAQVAQAQNVPTSLVVETILAPQSEILGVYTKYGYLSQQQADAIREQARLQIEQSITVPWYNTSIGVPTATPDITYDQGYAPNYGGTPWIGGGRMGSGMGCW